MKKRIAMLLAALMVAGVLTACGSVPNSVDDVLNSGNTNTDKEDGVDNSDDSAGYPEDGRADGYLGETMHTYWFDFTINSAYTCSEFDGLTPDEGYKFVVAEITMKNTTKYALPMSFVDFEIDWWDYAEGENEDEAFAFPMYEEIQNEDGESDYMTVSDLQLPTVYELSINEERTGILLYMVPEHAKNYSICFEEYFENDETGDLFLVWFNAEEK